MCLVDYQRCQGGCSQIRVTLMVNYLQTKCSRGEGLDPTHSAQHCHCSAVIATLSLTCMYVYCQLDTSVWLLSPRVYYMWHGCAHAQVSGVMWLPSWS